VDIRKNLDISIPDNVWDRLITSEYKRLLARRGSGASGRPLLCGHLDLNPDCARCKRKIARMKKQEEVKDDSGS
jgi:hypothetical protein